MFVSTGGVQSVQLKAGLSDKQNLALVSVDETWQQKGSWSERLVVPTPTLAPPGWNVSQLQKPPKYLGEWKTHSEDRGVSA